MDKPERTHRQILVRMPEDLYKKVKIVAEEEDRSMASLIRQSISQYVHHVEKT